MLQLNLLKTKNSLLFISFIVLSIACNDNIADSNYRNSKYAFYQEEGKSGKWIKVSANSERDFTKSKTTYFFDNGNRYAELMVLDSFPNRMTKFFDTKDELKITEYYSQDSLISKKYVDGHYKGYYSNKGNLKSEGTIKDNKLEGTWTYYLEDGNTIKQTIDYANSLFNGFRKDYYETGELQALISLKDGKKDGQAIYYYKNGEVKESKIYKEGIENGRLFKYFEDGSIQYSGTFWEGKEIDTSTTYFPSGKIKQRFICKADTINMVFEGKLITYFESGRSKSIFELLNWEANGESKFYNENGTLLKSIIYDNGKPIDSLIY